MSMKAPIPFTTITLLAGALLAANAAPKEDVTAAAKALADKSNYAWKQTVENAGGGGAGGGTSEGKIEKDGLLWLSLAMRDNKIEALRQGNKGALKTPEGWQSMSEVAGGDSGPATYAARRLQTYKAPAVQAEELAGKVKELKQDGDVYAGELTEEGAKSLLTFGGRGGGNAPEVSGAKGAVKFWVKDGVLAKYEIKVQGKVSFNGNDRDVDRTTTIEIKDIGSTKIEVPEEAKKKLG
jgi:hypothetical protein